jgi:sporulation protein YtfJ
MKMDNHPIGALMDTVMQKIRDMVDVNTIVGQPIATVEGITLIPISKVSFGFAGGGTDFETKNHQSGQDNPFGGGTGAGVKITPVAFLVIKDGGVKIINVLPPASTTVDRVIELVPDIVDKIGGMVSKEKAE